MALQVRQLLLPGQTPVNYGGGGSSVKARESDFDKKFRKQGEKFALEGLSRLEDRISGKTPMSGAGDLRSGLEAQAQQFNRSTGSRAGGFASATAAGQFRLKGGQQVAKDIRDEMDENIQRLLSFGSR